MAIRGASLEAAGTPSSEARLTLTMDGDPGATASPGGRPGGDPDDVPGLGASLFALRDAGRRLAQAHLDLLRVEMAAAGREIGIVVGLAIAALVLALLMAALLYSGFWLFEGEWLFGSIAWGLVHGMLFTIAIITGIGLDLAGAWRGAWPRGFLVGLAVAILLGLLFASNVLRQAAVDAGSALEPSLAIEPAALPTLVGLVTGAVVLGVVGLLVGWRQHLDGRGIAGMAVAGAFLGAIVGTILGSVTFDIQGAFAVSITIGLITWIVAAAALAAMRGFDPMHRYSPLIPRGTITLAQETQEELTAEWVRLRQRTARR